MHALPARLGRLHERAETVSTFIGACPLAKARLEGGDEILRFSRANIIAHARHQRISARVASSATATPIAADRPRAARAAYAAGAAVRGASCAAICPGATGAAGATGGTGGTRAAVTAGASSSSSGAVAAG